MPIHLLHSSFFFFYHLLLHIKFITTKHHGSMVLVTLLKTIKRFLTETVINLQNTSPLFDKLYIYSKG